MAGLDWGGGSSSGSSTSSSGGLNWGASAQAKSGAAPDPNQQIANDFARGIATLKQFAPEKAARLQTLYDQYGSDIPQAALNKAGLNSTNAYGGVLGSISRQVEKGTTGALGVAGRALGSAQQAIFQAVHPTGGQSRLAGLRYLDPTAIATGKARIAQAAGLGGELPEQQSLSQVLGKKAPSNPITKTLFNVANFVGGAALDPATYVTLGTGSLAKEGLGITAEVGGREAAQTVAKGGFKALDDVTRSSVESAIKSKLGEKGAGRVFDTLANGNAKLHALGQNFGPTGLPIRNEAILGRAELGDLQRSAVAEAEKPAVQQSLAGLGEGAPLAATQTGSIGANQAAKSLARASADTAASERAAQAATGQGLYAAVPNSTAARLKAAVIPRSVLDPATRDAFYHTAQAAEGAANLATSDAAKRFIDGSAGLTHSTADQILDAVKQLPEVSQESLRQLSAKSPADWQPTLNALADETRRVGNPEAIAKANGIDKLFEHLVAAPIRAQMGDAVRAGLESQGLDVARPDIARALEDWGAVKNVGTELNPGGKLLTAYRRAALRTPGYFARNLFNDTTSVLQEALSHKYGAREVPGAISDSAKIVGALEGHQSKDWADVLGPDLAKEAEELTGRNVTGGTSYTLGAKGAVENPRRVLSPIRLFDPVAKIGNRLSEQARIALYLIERRSGASVDSAADAVVRALGDYQDYTPFERKILKDHVVPFYKYHRFNTPFQLAKMLTSPKIPAAVLSLNRQFGSSEQASGPLPERIIQGMGLPLPGGRHFVVPPTGVEAALQIANVPAQVVSALPGVNRFSGKLQDSEGGLTSAGRTVAGLIGGPTTGGVVKEVLQWASGNNFMTGAPLTDQQKWRSTITDMLPEVGRVLRLSSASQSDWPRIILSMMVGIQEMDVTQASQRSEVYRRLDVLNKLLKDAETDGNTNNLLSQLGVTKSSRVTIPTLTNLKKGATLQNPVPAKTKAGAGLNWGGGGK